MDSFTLKLFTPNGLLLDESVREVTLPSSTGEIGILPSHTRYVGVLGIGVCEVTPVSGAKRRFVIAGGFCSFTDNVLQILADAVDTLEDVDRQSYAKDRAQLQQLVSQGSTYTPEWEQADRKLHRILAIDKLLGSAAH